MAFALAASGVPLYHRPIEARETEGNVLYTIIVVLVVLWLIGLIGNIGGGLIHLLLVVALVIFIANLLTGRKSAV